MRKILYLLLIHLLINGNTYAKQCQNDSTGLIPISDLEIQFNGWSGGLYGNWQNNMPEKHLNDGINIANSILPLDSNGLYNANGKIGFISIGMSNCNQFFEAFISKSKNYSDLNQNLQLLNCAVGGKDIDDFLDKQDTVWTIIKNRMLQSNLSNQQVQVIWFLQAKHISGIPKGEGIEHISIMYKKFLDLFRYLKNIFPNLQQIYSSGRDYGGYSDENRGNPEPYAYYTNWSFRKLVEEQINGNPNFRFSGENAPMPWLAWSNYIWADGKNKRKDGFNWICPEDLQEDGVHPSEKGKEKVTSMLLDFFSKDETTKWFRKSSTSSINEIHDLFLLSPNPASEYIEISLDRWTPLSRWTPSTIKIYDAYGECVMSEPIHPMTSSHRMNISHLPVGIYFIQIGNYSQKFMVER